jgi:Ca2+-binding RTX toxin-like protein
MRHLGLAGIALGAALALPASAVAGGPAVLVSINGDGELQIQGQEAPMATSVDYLAGTDEWRVTDPNALASAGCASAGAGLVDCPENGEDIDLRFGPGGGSATFAPADAARPTDFDSEIVLREGADTVIAGNGADVVTTASPTATAADSITTLGGADQITTGSGGDTINAGAGADTFSTPGNGGVVPAIAHDGPDTFNGGTEVDTVSYAGRSQRVVVSIGDGANDGQTTTGASGESCPGPVGCEGDDIAADVENIVGTSGFDALTGNAGNNQLDGASGDDTLAGGAGAGPDGADKLIGGADSFGDTVTYSPSGETARAGAISADLDGAADDGGDVNPANADAGCPSGPDCEHDEIEAAEHLVGGAAGDSLTGGTGENELYGGAGTGADTLSGGDEDDDLFGGTGANTGPDGADVFIAGNQGASGDTVDYQGRSGAITATIGGGADDGAGCPAQPGCEDDDVQAQVDNILGGNGGDTLTGDDDANTLLGRDGDDTYAGNAATGADAGDRLGSSNDTGIDTATYASRTTPVTVTVDVANAEGDLVGEEVEGLVGGSGDDVLTGGEDVDNTIDGGPGDDTLSGGDFLGGRPDTYIGGGNGAAGDTVTYAGTVSSVFAQIGRDFGLEDIRSDVENLSGGDGSDQLIGDADANVISGGLGDDTLAGGNGIGADGGDTFIAGNPGTNDTVSYATRTTPVVADIGPVGNPFNDGAGGCPAGPGCEGDSIDVGVDNIVGGSAADTLTGDSDGNTITGGRGADDLFGLGANDTLDGRDDGPDDLDCGTGAADVAQTDAGLETSIVDCETDDTSPRTRVTKKPRKKTAKRKAKFVFSSPTGATEFECVLDRQPEDKRKGGGPDFEPCTSPQVFNGLSRKRHRFEVRAIDGDGDADISPSLVKWKILKR